MDHVTAHNLDSATLMRHASLAVNYSHLGHLGGKSRMIWFVFMGKLLPMLSDFRPFLVEMALITVTLERAVQPGILYLECEYDDKKQKYRGICPPASPRLSWNQDLGTPYPSRKLRRPGQPLVP